MAKYIEPDYTSCKPLINTHMWMRYSYFADWKILTLDHRLHSQLWLKAKQSKDYFLKKDLSKECHVDLDNTKYHNLILKTLLTSFINIFSIIYNFFKVLSHKTDVYNVFYNENKENNSKLALHYTYHVFLIVLLLFQSLIRQNNHQI